MSLSTSTLLLFFCLVPGVVFRYYLYHGSIIYRPMFGDNVIYSSVVVVFLAAIVHFVTAIVFASFAMLGVGLFNYAYIYWLLPPPYSLSSFHGSIAKIWLAETAAPYHSIFIIGSYIVVASCVGRGLAAIVRLHSGKYSSTRRILYGSFADHLASSSINLLTAFVLTKVKHEDKVLVYAGFPTEVGLGDGTRINHIVLESPEKFFLTLSGEAPATTIESARPIGAATNSSTIFIDGGQIENVHLESWNFPLETASAAKH